MKILRRAAGPRLTLVQAHALRPNFTSVDALPETTSRIPLGAPGPIERYRTEFLFDYDIFPPSIMGASVQWRNEGRAIRVGDVIVQRAALPPFGLGLCAEFAVRITEIFDGPTKIGFAYQTLAGHAERGDSAFFIEDVGGTLEFVIRTRSEPGHWLARVVAPAFTLPFQRWCTARAMEHVQRRFRELNPR